MAELASPASLLVHLRPATGYGPQITREAPGDLQFTSNAPGGFATMSCTLPDIDTPEWQPALAQGAVAQVQDRRTGAVVWHGRLEDPGTSARGTGSTQKISAAGEQDGMDTFAPAPLAYIDRGLDGWNETTGYAAGSMQQVPSTMLGHPDDWPEFAADASPAGMMRLSIPEGSRVIGTPNFSQDAVLYSQPSVAYQGQPITSMQWSWQASTATANFGVRAYIYNAAGTLTQVYSVNWDTVQADVRRYRGGTGWPIGTEAYQVSLRWIYGGASADANSELWAQFANVVLIFGRKTYDGADYTGHASSQVDTGDITDDVIGRYLQTRFEVLGRPARSSQPVEQAAWWEGVTPREVFEFVDTLAPGYTWGVWEPGNTGKPRFSYVSWERQAPYIVPPEAVRWNLAGGLGGLYNRALVTYTSRKNLTATILVTGDVPELNQSGLLRRLAVDVRGEGPVSTSTAVRKGGAALKAANTAPISGTATIIGPILDRQTGRMVQPWEIRAGVPIHLPTLQRWKSFGSPQNGARDGVALFRVTGTRYDRASNSCELTLDGGARRGIHSLKARFGGANGGPPSRPPTWTGRPPRRM